MAATLISNLVVPELFTPALRDAAGKKLCLVDSPFVASGCLTIEPNFPGVGPSTIGTVIKVPRWDALSPFVLNPEGTSQADPDATVGQSYDTATVARASHKFIFSRASNSSPGQEGQTYQQYAEGQMREAKEYMDAAAVAAAIASGNDYMVNSTYSSSTPKTLTYADILGLRALFGDQSDNIGAIAIHPNVEADLLALKGATDGAAMFAKDANGKPVKTILGIPYFPTSRAPVVGTYGSVTPAGTSPPTVTLSGTSNRALGNLSVACTTLGARGTSVIKYSTDGEKTWITGVTTGATITIYDTRTYNTRKRLVATGITLAMEDAAAAVNNTWKANISNKYGTLAMLPGALTFWYNAAALEVITTVLGDSDQIKCNSHLYYAVNRNSRCSTFDGIGVGVHWSNASV